MMSNTITSGTIIIIQWENVMPMFSPVGSLRYFKANTFGGVPIGVPIPPKLAPTGMAIVSAILPLPFAGSALNTGVRKVSIIAAVAVLEMNMENTPVMRRKPKSTFSLFCPKGFISVRAARTSRPLLVAAIANTKPPKNKMIVGSAKHAMTPTWSSIVPY